jgi:hypothetical protein
MTIFYFFLSSKDVASTQGSVNRARSSWASQLHTVLRSHKKLDELAASCISGYDPLYSVRMISFYTSLQSHCAYFLERLTESPFSQNSILIQTLFLMAHFEAAWWVQTNIAEYKATNTFVIPKLSKHSLLSWKEWKTYWAEVKERVMPIVLEHQASVLLLYCFKELITLFASKETCCRLTQHPFYRSRAISFRESDRLTAGMEMIAVSLWANLLFFASNYYVGRLRALYNIKRKRDNTQQQQQNRGALDERSMALFWTSSWRSSSKTCRRYVCASLGGGLGSMLWSGWGTMVGLGAGDAWAALQPDSNVLLDQLPGSTPRSGDVEKKSSFSSTLQEELLCGCCQIVSFSSNVHSRKRAPVSSRTCDHTICKSCVEQCQLALMERTSSYEESIKCPLCNAQNAFNSHDHLVNRSLCAAIAMIESQAVQ